jgi:hypothetical protein
MATIAATITNLRIENQGLAFSIGVTGDAGGQAAATMMVYDAAGTERERTDLGTMAAGESWDATLDLPGATLGDGDYGAWVYIGTTAADGQPGPVAQEGISFLVGRGQIYPSREHADKRQFTTPPTLSGIRLEGSWVVFDMTNHDTSDLEVFHQFAIGVVNSGDQQLFHGQELVRAGATQQGHYLLPDGLADGAYLAIVTVQNEGSDFVAPAVMELRVDGNVFTVTSTSP